MLACPRFITFIVLALFASSGVTIAACTGEDPALVGVDPSGADAQPPRVSDGGGPAPTDAGGADAAFATVKLALAVKEIATGAAHSCAVLSTGKLACWGDNSSGQLGLDPLLLPSSVDPVEVPGVANVRQVAAGVANTCAWIEPTSPDGGIFPNVLCWGDQYHGALGRGEPNGDKLTSKPVPAAAFVKGVQVTPAKFDEAARRLVVGRAFACAIQGVGGACWGDGESGQIFGRGTFPSSSTANPTAGSLPGSASMVEFAAGTDFACASATGGVYCWGKNDKRQIDATGQPKDQATLVVGANPDFPYGGIAAGRAHACAIDTDGALQCWGDGNKGQNGGSGPRGYTQVVPLEQSVARVAAGGDTTCYLTSAGAVRCFGGNDDGQLGTGQKGVSSSAPKDVAGVGGLGALTNVAQIAVGERHACARLKGPGFTGAFVCWGANDRGQSGPAPAALGGSAVPAAVP